MKDKNQLLFSINKIKENKTRGWSRSALAYSCRIPSGWSTWQSLIYKHNSESWKLAFEVFEIFLLKKSDIAIKFPLIYK